MQSVVFLLLGTGTFGLTSDATNEVGHSFFFSVFIVISRNILLLY